MEAVWGFVFVVGVVVMFFVIERLTQRPFDALEERQTRRTQSNQTGRRDGREAK